MKYLLLLLMFFCLPISAGTVLLEGVELIEYDDEYSFKDYSQGRISLLDGVDLAGEVIYASNFYQDDAGVDKLPHQNYTLVKCNVDNLIIPEEVTLIQTEPNYIEMQNDQNYWHVDNEGKPTVPLGFEVFQEEGLPMPEVKDIPAEKADNPINLFEKAIEIQEAAELEGVVVE